MAPAAWPGATGASPRRSRNAAPPPTPAMAPKASAAPASHARDATAPTFVPHESDASTAT